MITKKKNKKKNKTNGLSKIGKSGLKTPILTFYHFSLSHFLNFSVSDLVGVLYMTLYLRKIPRVADELLMYIYNKLQN